MKDKTIIWMVVGALLFWLAILFPETAGKVFRAIGEFGHAVVSFFSGK
jgi:hypothetical protein